MANPRESQQEPGREDLQNESAFGQQEGLNEAVSRYQDSPQRGEQESDDQMRNVSSTEGENFYQNRERGNYTEGQRSEGGGGSLY